jgi:hypothetical protein
MSIVRWLRSVLLIVLNDTPAAVANSIILNPFSKRIFLVFLCSFYQSINQRRGGWLLPREHFSHIPLATSEA